MTSKLPGLNYLDRSDDAAQVEIMRLVIRVALLYGMDVSCFDSLLTRYYSDTYDQDNFLDSVVNEYGPLITMGWNVFEYALRLSCYDSSDLAFLSRLFYQEEKTYTIK